MNGLANQDKPTEMRILNLLAGVKSRLSRVFSAVVGADRAAAASSAFNELGEKHPFIQAFLVVWAALALCPLLTYLSFVLACIALATVVSCLFVAFWAGVAMLVFVPALLVASGAALLVFFWGCVGVFVLQMARGFVGGGDGAAKKLQGKDWHAAWKSRAIQRPGERYRSGSEDEGPATKAAKSPVENPSGRLDSGVDFAADIPQGDATLSDGSDVIKDEGARDGVAATSLG